MMVLTKEFIVNSKLSDFYIIPVSDLTIINAAVRIPH